MTAAVFVALADAWLAHFEPARAAVVVAPRAAAAKSVAAGFAFYASGGSLLAPMALHAASALADALHAPGADDRLVVELPAIDDAADAAATSDEEPAAA